MRLLLTGDIHIGRSSTGISSPVGRDDLRAAAAWSRIVDLAIQEEADLVCLSGDIVDKENKFWEAIGPLERGVERLAGAGIRTVAVGGNHDYDVLARLADQLPPEDFHLLGRRGKWERLTIEEDGRRALHVDGWSFPKERVYDSPLETYDLEPDTSTPILGIVHGDLDVADSPYAPLDTDRLLSLAPNAWLLGHIHKPALKTSPAGSWILYPGSPQALDFGEPGLHGAWLLEVDGRIGAPEQRPISTVRFDYLDVDVTGAESEEDVEGVILRAIREAAQTRSDEGAPYLKSLSLRLNVTGRTALAHKIGEITARLVDDLDLPVGATTVVVNRVRVTAIPNVNLHEYAGAQSAPGAVARLLLGLEAQEPSREVADLIAQTKRELVSVDSHKHFAALDEREITDEVVRAYLRDQANALLTELVQQTA